MFCRKTIVLTTLSIVSTMGSVLGATVHLMLAQSLEKNLMFTKASKQNVALITLYLQIPQHVFEIICVVFLVYGLIQSKRQFMLPWLIVNAIGIALYSTILLVMGMILSGYVFCGYILIGCYGYLWYHIQSYYNTLVQRGDSDIMYTIMT